MNLGARVLLVEGRDDKHVILSLAKHYRLDEIFSIKGESGIEGIFETLPVQLKGSNIERVGVLLDADIAVDSRWAAIMDLLRKAGYTAIPHTPDVNGTIIIQSGLPHFGVWIMPNNALPGMLEDFIAFLVPKTDKLYSSARHAVDNITSEDRLFANSHTSKAYIHTWLAWQENPGTPLGLAITKKYLEANAPQASALVSWLRRLFY